MNILSSAYDIVVLTETWLIPEISDGEFIDNRYNVFRCDRDRLATNKSDGGGVLIAIRRDLKPVSLPINHCYSVIEHIIVSIPSFAPAKKHYISAVYIPPQTPNDIYLDHFTLLQDYVNDHSTESFFILGDYNLPHVDWSNFQLAAPNSAPTSISYNLFNFLSTLNAKQFNSLKNDNDRILDLFISNTESSLTLCSPIVPPNLHHPPFCALTFVNLKTNHMPRNHSPKPNFHKGNYEVIN